MKNVSFKRITLDQAIENGLNYLYIPAIQQEYDLLKKYPAFIADITISINNRLIDKLFAIIRKSLDNDIFNHIKYRDTQYNASEILITSIYIDSLLLSKKNEVDVLLYILKILFLPYDVIENGISVKSLTKLDQIEMQKFYDESLDFLSFRLGINRNILERYS